MPITIQRSRISDNRRAFCARYPPTSLPVSGSVSKSAMTANVGSASHWHQTWNQRASPAAGWGAAG